MAPLPPLIIGIRHVPPAAQGDATLGLRVGGRGHHLFLPHWTDAAREPRPTPAHVACAASPRLRRRSGCASCPGFRSQNSRADASRAPSLRARSFAQTTSGATRPHPAEVSKPQSFAASTADASPITATIRSIRSDTTSGCSMMLVSGSITPATRICPDFSGNFSKQRNSCA